MVEKWIGPAAKRMEKKGTTGSLREIARRRGMLAGKGDTLTCGDVAKLKQSKDPEIVKKANFAFNAMKCGK